MSEDRREFSYLPYKSGGEAATQLVGNHTESNVNNPSENLEVWRAGQVRPLCVFDKERISYKTKVTETRSWNDIPTCKEAGLDVQYLMLRAMFLPGKVTPEQQAFYVDLFQKVTQTPEYKDYMEKQALKPIFLTGKDMLQFLEEDDALNKQLMTKRDSSRSKGRQAPWSRDEQRSRNKQTLPGEPPCARSPAGSRRYLG